jgi:hypothetical protein
MPSQGLRVGGVSGFTPDLTVHAVFRFSRFWLERVRSIGTSGDFTPWNIRYTDFFSIF